jgi:hypothetical protein
MKILVGVIVLLSGIAHANPGITSDQVAITGYGVMLRPKPPYQIGRMTQHPTPDALLLAHEDGKLKNALIIPGKTYAGDTSLKREWVGKPGESVWAYRQRADATRITLGVGMEDVAEVGTASAGTPERAWFIQTPDYRVKWPAGYTLNATTSDAAWPFELSGPDDGMIILRGPLIQKDVPAFAKMIAPDQKLVGQGKLDDSVWIELEYQKEGAQWRQRHYYGALGKKIVIVTGQAPAAHSAEIATACELLVRSLKAMK